MGSRGRAAGQGVKKAKPPEAENLLDFGAQQKQQICFIPDPISRVATVHMCGSTDGDDECSIT